ncbi:MAG: DinB family protein [Candidatus Eisenbacteria bacterium]|nr:DinB family protein [Candidatus Eisenbacteria bacterium]
MIRAARAEARVFQSWLDYQSALKRAIAPLSPDQLEFRPISGRRSAGEIAEHIVFGRALHTHRVLGDEATTVKPFLSWDRSGESPRSGADIVEGLEVTWGVIERALMRGDAMDEVSDSEEPTVEEVIWGLLDHDLPHAGQLSLILRAAGLPGVEI